MLKELRKAKLKELEAIYQTAEKAGRDLTDDEHAAAESLEKEIAGLDQSIAGRKALDDRLGNLINEDDLKKTTDNTVQLAPFTPSSMSAQGAVKDDCGFKSIGEFVHSIRFAPHDSRLKSLAREIPKNQDKAETFATTDIAFLMPPKIYEEILELDIAGMSIVRPRAMVFPAGDIMPDAAITVPMVDQTGEDSNIFGGVEVTWIGEGDFKPETTKKLKSVTITPYELAASIRVTDKALRNFPALSPLFNRNLFLALWYAQDIAFLQGEGDSTDPDVASQPTGILTSDAILEVTRAKGDKFLFEDAVNMMSRGLPNAINGMAWVIDQTLMLDVFTMQDPSGRFVYGPRDVAEGRPETLLGRPILWTDRTAKNNKPAVVGDVMLADFTYYGIKDGFGPMLAASPHPFFQNNVTVIKAFTNVGGKPLLDGPVTLLNGMQVSPFVALAPVSVGE